MKLKTTTFSWVLSRLAVIMAVAAVAGGCNPKALKYANKPEECRNPKYVDAMKGQAINFYNAGKYIEALKSITQAAQCKPKDPEVYYWMGLIYHKRHKLYEAIDAFKKALEIDKTHTDSRMALGVMYLELERWDEAIAQFETCAEDELFLRPWEAYSNLAWAYLQKGDLLLAENAANKAIEANPNFCIAYTNRGEIAVKQGLNRKGILDYQKAIQLCPANYARPHFLLGVEYGRLGYYAQACDEFSKAAIVEGAPEAEQSVDYMRLYNCPGVVR